MDYPPRPYDYDDRDPKRIRGPPPEPRDIPYSRPPLFDDRGPPQSPEFERPYPPYRGPNNREFPRRERTRAHGRYFLVKTSTAENISKSRETVPSQLIRVLTGRVVGEFLSKTLKSYVKPIKSDSYVFYY